MSQTPSATSVSTLPRPIRLSERPTKESLARFPRALSILKLKVFVHPNQKGAILSPSLREKAKSPGETNQQTGIAAGGSEQSKARNIEDPEITEAYATASWPQLTLLNQSHS